MIVNNNDLGDQNQTNSAGGTGTRAIYGGGGPAPATTTIDYFTVSTLGNAVDFGDLTAHNQEQLLQDLHPELEDVGQQEQ